MHSLTKLYLQNNYSLYETDYRDSVNAELMAECLKTKDDFPIWNAIESNDDTAIQDAVSSIKEQMEADNLGHIFIEDEDEIRDWIEYHDTSNPVRDLCRNTTLRARILQHSNYECWIPPYDAKEITYDGAFKEAVDMLALNPKEVKQELLKWTDCPGRWPDRTKRKPIVDVKEFSKCCRNMCCYGAWGFFGTIKGSYLYDTHFTIPANAVIPEGTTCGWCNWWNGGGTLEPIKTIRDTTFSELDRRISKADIYSEIIFEIDEKNACNGYSIMPEVYGDTIEEHILKY